MLIRAFPLPDELGHGYFGRLMRINYSRDPNVFYQRIAAWADLADKNRREVSKIKLLACASGLSLPQFVSRHTTLPLRRAITSYFPNELHGDEAKQGVLWTSALRITRPDIYFCPDCIEEDLDFYGYSYWRRVNRPGN